MRVLRTHCRRSGEKLRDQSSIGSFLVRYRLPAPSSSSEALLVSRSPRDLAVHGRRMDLQISSKSKIGD